MVVRTKTEFNFIAPLTDPLNIYPSAMYQVCNVNWSAFLNSILATLQSHSWNNGTHGGCKLGSGDLGLLPLTMWPTGVSLATAWVPWLFMVCAKWGFFATSDPTHFTPSLPATHPIHPLYYQY